MSWLEEIEQRWAAALRGPWHWSGFAKHPRVGSARVALVTSHSGQKYIICADPDDGLMLRCPDGPGLAPAVDVAEYQEHNGVITGMRDPNATAIAAAPSDIARLVAEVKRLQDAEKALRRLVAVVNAEDEHPVYNSDGENLGVTINPDGTAMRQARKALAQRWAFPGHHFADVTPEQVEDVTALLAEVKRLREALGTIRDEAEHASRVNQTGISDEQTARYWAAVQTIAVIDAALDESEVRG